MVHVRLSFLLFFIAISPSVFSQTFSGTGGAIPDNSTTVQFTINVSGLTPANIDSISFGLQSVCINISHNNDGDLDVELISPDGTRVQLTTRNGGGGNNYTSTCFSATAATPVFMNSAPFSGSYKPQGDLGIINNNQNGNGAWKISITDLTMPTSGTLNNWSITFGNSPAKPFPFLSSNLPIIKINTSGGVIKDDPRIVADMLVIYNGPGNRNYFTDLPNNYTGKIAVEMRGSTSQQYPKRSFALETQDILGNNLNVSLLGMPVENDWILYAPYPDKTLIRNTLTFDVSRKIGNYASRTKHVELFINGSYMGVFELLEKIKIDNNRVNIASLSPIDTTGDKLTGGYIVKVDKTTGSGSLYWTSPYSPKVIFQWHDPEDILLTVSQRNYIQNYVTTFENTLNSPNFSDPLTGFRQYVVTQTFIDFMILEELGRTVDGYRSSSFLHKERDSRGGKLRAGPMWDFNLSYGNADYCDGFLTNGWQFNFDSVCNFTSAVPFWWMKFQQDTTFNNEYRCRWESQRTAMLNTATLMAWIDSMAIYLNESQQRNFVKWPILGTYVNWNFFVGNTYQEEIDYLKQWMSTRSAWMDANIPGTCWPSLPTETGEVSYFNDISVYPNPNKGKFRISALGFVFDRVEIYNVLGENIFSTSNTKYQLLNEIDLSGNPCGVYIVNVYSEKEIVRKKIIITK